MAELVGPELLKEPDARDRSGSSDRGVRNLEVALPYPH